MNNLNKKLAILSKSQSGMTLVEILVALGIMAIMLTATLTMLPQYRSNQQLRQASLDIMNSLRKAQTLAMAPDDADADGYVWVSNKGHLFCERGNDRMIAIVPVKKGIDPLDPNNEKPLSKDKCFEYDNFYGASKIKFQNAITSIYFEAKTGKMSSNFNFNDSGFTTTIKFSHITAQNGDLAYIISVKDNNFRLERGKIEEISNF